MKNLNRLFFAAFILFWLGLQPSLPVVALPLMPTVDNNYWLPDGPVYALANDPVSGTLFLGGAFKSINPYTGHMLSFSSATGLRDPNFSSLNNDVNVIIPDPNGGWYVGGAFYRVDGSTYQGIARFNADWTIDINFVHFVNGPVYALAAIGNRLFVGGNFTRISGSRRNNLAVIELSGSGSSIFPWTPSPDPDGAVRALYIDGDNLFVGGEFTTIAGVTRPGLASFNNLSTSLTWRSSWDAKITGSVYTLDSNDNFLFAGGNFTIPGGQNLALLAEADAAVETSFTPQPDGTVRVVKVTGRGTGPDARIYVGGEFQNINAVGRHFLARYQPAVSGTGYELDAAYQPQPDAAVLSLAEADTQRMYVGGEFHRIGSTSPLNVNQLARVDSLGEPDAGWMTDLQVQSGSVYAIANGGDRIIAGGSFFSAGGVKSSGLAALGVNGQPESAFTAQVNGSVHALLLKDGLLYAGGSFNKINAELINNLAALNPSTGVPTTWRPDPNGSVLALSAYSSASNDFIIAGGSFTSLRGNTVNRSRLALINQAGSGTVGNAVPGFNGPVQALALNQNRWLLVGGSFTAPIQYAARLDLQQSSISAQPLPAPAFTSPVHSILTNWRTILLGSDRLDALDPYTYVPVNTYPDLSTSLSTDGIYALAATGGDLYTGGNFYFEHTYSGDPGPTVISTSLLPIGYDGTTTQPEWMPPTQGPAGTPGEIRALLVADGTVYAGGTFNRFGMGDAVERPYLIVLEAINSPLPPPPTPTPTPHYDIFIPMSDG